MFFSIWNRYIIILSLLLYLSISISFLPYVYRWTVVKPAFSCCPQAIFSIQCFSPLFFLLLCDNISDDKHNKNTQTITKLTHTQTKSPHILTPTHTATFSTMNWATVSFFFVPQWKWIEFSILAKSSYLKLKSYRVKSKRNHIKSKGGEHVDIWTLSLLHEAFHYIANVFLLCRCDCLSLLDVVDLNSLASYHVNHFHCVKISVDLVFFFLFPWITQTHEFPVNCVAKLQKVLTWNQKDLQREKKNRSSKHLYIFLFTSLEIFTCLTKIFRYAIAHVSLNIRSVVFNFRFNANEHEWAP